MSDITPNYTRGGGQWLQVGFLMLLAFVLFANTFGHAWTYDDFPVIVENADIRSLANFFADSYPGRPLRELSYLVDYTFFGLQPTGYHIQNIFWHGLNAGLLLLLALRLGASRGVAWLAALLFLAHPVQVEVVANIAHRKDSLVLAFILLSLLAYIEAFRPGRKKALWLLGAVAAGWVALQAKQNAVVLPLLWMAYEGLLVPPEKRLLLRRWWPVAALAVVAVAAVAVWYWQFGGREQQLRPMFGVMAKMNQGFTGESVEPYYLLLFKSLAFMFRCLVYPLHLGPEYTYSAPKAWSDPWVLGALAGLGVYLAALAATIRRRPLAAFGLLWLGLLWLPVSNLWPLSYFAADRYLYAPMAGFALLLALGLDCLPGRGGLRNGVGLLLVVALAVLTWQQNGVWKSPRTLWAQAVKVNPKSTTALNNMGGVFLQADELEQALVYFQKAAANFNDPMPYYNMGKVYEKMNRPQQALSAYRNFLAFDEPKYRQMAADLRLRLWRQYGVRLP